MIYKKTDRQSARFFVYTPCNLKFMSPESDLETRAIKRDLLLEIADRHIEIHLFCDVDGIVLKFPNFNMKLDVSNNFETILYVIACALNDFPVSANTQTCSDVDHAACLAMKAQAPDMCTADPMLAKTLCPATCNNCLIAGTLGPICLHCTDISGPTHCDTIAQCGAHEKCYLDVFANSVGGIVYRQGCRDSRQCQQEPFVGKRDISGDLLVCSHCCSGNVCNSAGCGHTGYPSPHGPVCFSCQDQLKTDNCNKITLCGVDEECEADLAIFQKIISPGKQYVGDSLSSAGICLFQCCSTDVCNNGCSNDSQSTSASTTTVTTLTSSPAPTDCYDILHMNIGKQSGVYTVTTWKSHRTIKVYCDMATDGGGWTVFQSRFNGYVSFYRNLSEYENGFGSVYGEFWLGLSYVQEMAEQAKTVQRFDCTYPGGKIYWARPNFHLGTAPDYTLHADLVGTGTFGTIQLAGTNHRFVTFDHDVNDCAYHQGAWWFDDDCVGALYPNFDNLILQQHNLSTQLKFRRV